MKKLLIVLAVILSLQSSAQSAKEMLAEIHGKYSLDDNGNVTYVRVVDLPTLSKDEIYLRALNYFTYNYSDGKSVIQTQDKEQGVVVGKGVYDNVHIGASLITTYIDCWHIVRVDIKENKARIIVTLTEYDKKIVGGDTPPSYVNIRVSESYPINPNGNQKTVMTKAMYRSHKAALSTIDRLEVALLEGTTAKGIEGAGW